jgi:hypothetical protein
MKRIYLSGKMSNVKDLNIDKFKKWKKILQEKGFEVIIPHEIEGNEKELSYDEYMKNDIAELLKCDIVGILDDWYHSPGSIKEIIVSRIVGIKVYTVESILNGEFKEFDKELKYLSTVWKK